MSLVTRTLSALGFEKRSNNGDPYWDNFKALRTGAVTPQAAETLSTVSPACRQSVKPSEACPYTSTNARQRAGSATPSIHWHACYMTHPTSARAPWSSAK
jgi:hypothetical protein